MRPVTGPARPRALTIGTPTPKIRGSAGIAQLVERRIRKASSAVPKRHSQATPNKAR